MTLSETPTPASPSYRTLALASLGIGGLLLAGSVCAGLLFLLVPLSGTQGALATNTALGSFVALAMGYGGLLVLTGRGLLRDQGSARFHLPPPILFVVGFLVVLVIGQAILTVNVGAAYLFPAWHVLASLLVPMTALSFATRRLEPVSLRSMLAQVSWGGLVTIALAVVFEVVIGIVLFAVAAIAATLVLGAERMRQLGEAFQAGASDPQRLLELLSGEPVALLIAAAAALVMFVLIVPLLEEILKATGPAILLARRVRANGIPSKSEAVLWGLAAGAGYAFTENMFNAQGGATTGDGLVGFWAAAMLLRAGTSLLHMVATATVAVGWYQALVNKNTRRLLLLLAAATAAHAAWNTGAVLLGGVSVLNQAGGNLALASTLLTFAVLLFLILLFVGFLVWLVRLVRWAQPAPVEIITPTNVTGRVVENVREF